MVKMSLESGKLRKKLIRQQRDLTDYTEQNIALIGENMTLIYENKKLKTKVEKLEKNLTEELKGKTVAVKRKSQFVVVMIS
jgi:regulator of replication initiation timing